MASGRTQVLTLVLISGCASSYSEPDGALTDAAKGDGGRAADAETDATEDAEVDAGPAYCADGVAELVGTTPVGPADVFSTAGALAADGEGCEGTTLVLWASRAPAPDDPFEPVATPHIQIRAPLETNLFAGEAPSGEVEAKAYIVTDEGWLHEVETMIRIERTDPADIDTGARVVAQILDVSGGGWEDVGGRIDAPYCEVSVCL